MTIYAPLPLLLPAENDNTTPKADSADGLSTAHSPSQQQEPHIGRDLEADEEEATKVKQEPFADEEEDEQQQQQQLEEQQQQQTHSELELLARDECQQPLAKRPKMELVDAEANTVHTGEQASQSITPFNPCLPLLLVVFNCRIAAS